MRELPYGMGRGRIALRTLAVLVTTLSVAACGNSGSGGSGGGHHVPPTPVHTVTVQPHSVAVYSEYPGRVQGKQTAKVIGQVTGVLLAKHYREGAVVHKGDPLFTIDPKPYQATVDQRKAELASAKAALANATRVWHRTRQLYKANAVSQAQRDQDLSTYQSDKASVEQARANLQSAEINLNYTHVDAPITGVTSLRDVDLGSLVTANQTQLTTITQLNPVYVLFSLPENDAFARRKALGEMGKQSSDASTRQATILLGNGQTYPEKGQVDFTQSTIDPNTGTVQMRAVVKNPHNVLMPGRYVRVRLRIQTLPNAITVPDQAVSDSGQRTLVYIVSNGKAKAMPVKLGPETKQGRVISHGLSKGDQVITSGLASLSTGSPVKPLPGGGQHAGKAGSGSTSGGSSSKTGGTDASQNS